MDTKELVTYRLKKLQLVEAVLPTRSTRSETLMEAARSIRRDEIPEARAQSSKDLAERGYNGHDTPAIAVLSGTSTLREQMAGFADAGLNFLHADQETIDAPLSERSERGASDIVSRVLLSDQRILLETKRIIIGFKPDVEPELREQILGRHGVVPIADDGMPSGTIRAVVTQGGATRICIRLMESEDAIDYAEPDFIEHIGRRDGPSGIEFDKQWHHATIEAADAWAATAGDGASIAVIDNGCEAGHPDLVFGPLSAWYRGTPGGEDADFVPGTARMPNSNHGTACAGMAAGRAGDGGRRGVAHGAELIMISCLGDQVGTQTTLARAVAYAANPRSEMPDQAGLKGADVIVCSLGPNGASWDISQTLSLALHAAADQGRDGKGCAILWASTNGNYPIGNDKVCSHPKVMAVGRSTKSDGDDGSGYGPELEFLAPGVGVYIPAAGGGYHATTGTSFAAPCAAGVAALAISANRDLTAAALKDILRNSCDKIGDLPYVNGRNVRFGHGRLNARKAVELAGESFGSS